MADARERRLSLVEHLTGIRMPATLVEHQLQRAWESVRDREVERARKRAKKK